MEEDIVEVPNQNLIEYLKFYCSIDNPQFAILINGKWGSGKTFFIKKLLNEWSTKSENDNEENIILKPIYISLYGLSNLNEINTKIKETLHPLLYSKTAKTLAKIFFGVLKTTANMSFDSNGDGRTDGKVSFDVNSLGILKNPNERIKGSKIIVFDDLERCEIELKVLFGYINEFVEHYNCKVILLADEDRIIKKSKGNESYNEFKEKLIRQTFTIQTDLDNAIISFTGRLTESFEKEFLLISLSLIKSFFNASKIENLRILKQSILDFVRFTDQFDSTVKQHAEYIQFLNNLLPYFLIVYLEYKSGNQKIADIGYYSVSQAQKDTEAIIKSKYNSTLEEFQTYYRTNVIEYISVVEFINKGYSDKIRLNNYVKRTPFFKDTSLLDWEKLWRWDQLEEEEFKLIYNSVLANFNNYNYTNNTNYYHLLNATVALLSLNEKGIVLGDMSHIFSSYKTQIDLILEKNGDEMFEQISSESYTKNFTVKETVDKIEAIISYSNEGITLHNLHHRDEYIKAIFENLTNESFHNFQNKLDRSMPDRSASYSLGPILTNIDGYILGGKLLRLSNKNLQSFFYFLERRYCPNGVYNKGYYGTNSQDKECISSIMKTFKSNIESLSPLNRHSRTEHINFLAKLIELMDNSENVETTITV